MKTILITGATGFLGSSLAAALLARGHRTLLVCRGNGAQRPAERALSTLSRHGPTDAYGDRLAVIMGDISLPMAGVSRADAARLRGTIDAVVHCAALAKFAEEDDRLMAHNVRGTGEVHRLAVAVGAREFHHVSTAYVAGRRRGVVREDDLDDALGFRNGYEHSKYLAERLLRDRSGTGAPRLTIHRPGIIVGDSRTGMTMNYDNLYVYLRLLSSLRREKPGCSLRIEGDPRATKNLVPIDIVTRAMVAVIENPARQGKTYHIVHPHPPTVGGLLTMVCDVLGIDRQAISLVPDGVIPAGRAEKLFKTQTNVYRQYMIEEPLFDTTNLSELLAAEGIEVPPIDASFIRRLMRHALRMRWGRRPSAPSDEVTEYFTNFLPRFLHRQLIPSLVSLTTAFSIRLSDRSDDEWSVRIENGRMTEIVEGSDSESRCAYEIDRAAFLDIVTDKITAQKAFFLGKVRIGGDILHGLKVAVVLGEFFHRYPFVRGRETGVGAEVAHAGATL